jgi:hypothetical protein
MIAQAKGRGPVGSWLSLIARLRRIPLLGTWVNKGVAA